MCSGVTPQQQPRMSATLVAPLERQGRIVLWPDPPVGAPAVGAEVAEVGIDAEREVDEIAQRADHPRHVVDGETVDEQGPHSHLLEAKGGTQERITLWAAPVLPVDPARSVQASPERKPHGDAGVKQRRHRRHGEVTDERQRLHQDEVGSIVFEHPG